jgi:hypothetical protein
MAQVWLSYAEIEELISIAGDEVRDRVSALGYDRRRCHDGLTRVKLPEQLAEAYMLNFAIAKLASPVAAMHSMLEDALGHAGADGNERLNEVERSGIHHLRAA